ncbi:hypothetical protein MMC25_003602 [Agyrium rufum]|nr:hypothetical protein [Agyrium rufum]
MRVLRDRTLLILLLLAIRSTTALAQQGLPTLPSSNTDGSLPTIASDSSSASKTASSSAAAKTTDDSSAAASLTTDGGLPAGASATGFDGPTDLPTITPTNNFNYPPPTVPPTQNEAYMQKSSLPEGTVFIAVGAALGFIFLAMIAWRGLVAWSLHRSVKRNEFDAARGKYKSYGDVLGGHHHHHGRGLGSDVKNSVLRNVPFYNQHGNRPESAVSLEHLAPKQGKSGLKSSHQTPASSLFFSPTAGAGKPPSSGVGAGGGYLPAGYYAPGTNPAASTSTMTGLTGMARPASMNLAGETAYHGATGSRRSLGPSPPGTPGTLPMSGSNGGSVLGAGLPAPSASDVTFSSRSTLGNVGGAAAGSAISAGAYSSQPSSSTLNLQGQGQRAPSAYLDELFESHPPRKARQSLDRRY